MNLVLIQPGDEVSLQAVTLARGLGGPVHALLIGTDEGAAALGVDAVHIARHDGLTGFAPDAWARIVVDTAERVGARAVVAAGNERGNDVLARAAARAGEPMAANCVSVMPGDPLVLTRVRWGGSLLEEARLHAGRAFLTVAPHAVAGDPPGAPGTVGEVAVELDAADLAVIVRERVALASGGISLADAKVVVTGGRGVGSAEGFAPIEDLAGLLGGAVGCSRAVTMAGWRSHNDQVGQTGTKIAPEIYIPCGVSGATQHIAGCKGAKRILAINKDPEAPIFAVADYAVIGDLHEVVPAIAAELREAPRMSAVGTAALAVVLVVAAVLFGRRALLLYRIVRMGRPVARFDDVPARVRNEATIVLGQRKLLQRLGPGLMHAFIFWGFLVLLPTIFMALIAIVSKDSTIPWLGRQAWFAFMVDLFAVMVLCGVIAAFVIRKVQRPRRFEGSHRGEADVILLLIAGIVTTLLLWHACRIALGLNEWPADWSPVSDALSNLFGDDSVTETLERMLAWAHVLLILGFLVYLPYSKHLHIATAGINVYFGRTRGRGRLEPLQFDEAMPEAEMRFGMGTIGDMTWKQMLDTLSCTECGRCQDVCPAFNTGKALSPKLLVMGLRDALYAQGPDLLAAARAGEPFAATPLVPAAVTDDVVWDCVTCGACVRECPVSIEHVDHIVDLRRHLVMVDARFPAEGATMLRDVERSANPWGKTQTERADWAEGLGIRVLEPGDAPPEVLFWVGCAPAFDERAREGARSTARLMQLAGVDFAILGPRECCTGDPSRRMGDEYTFQSYAQQNVGTLAESRVTRIVTTCPHCFNTLSNEYPDFGGTYDVVHHTELLADLVRDGKLKPTPGEAQITYHDSCYLARHNDVREAPRELVAAVGHPVEMTKNRERTFCCGAGGAHMWMEERAGAINEERVRQATATGAGTLAVACPFCTVMLDDGVRSGGGSIEVRDVATLLLRAVEG